MSSFAREMHCSWEFGVRHLTGDDTTISRYGSGRCQCLKCLLPKSNHLDRTRTDTLATRLAAALYGYNIRTPSLEFSLSTALTATTRLPAALGSAPDAAPNNNLDPAAS